MTRPREPDSAALASLTTLAEEINREHAAAEKAINESLVHARRCGELLIEAKRGCAHGEWTPWVEGNFAGSARTARAYMRIAARWDELPRGQNGNALPVRAALAALAEPRETDQAVEQEPEPTPEPALVLPEPGAMIFATAEVGRLGFLAHVVPSADHAGFYYVSVMSWDRITDENAMVEGGARPIHGDSVPRLLDAMRFPVRHTEWHDGRAAAWSWNELLFEDHGDYMQRWVLA